MIDELSFEHLALDPYSVTDQLRQTAALTWVPRMDLWLLVSYNDAITVLKDTDTFGNESERSTIQRTLGRQMLSTDGPDQQRFRRSCLAPFSAKAVRGEWRQRVETICCDLLESVRQRGDGRGELMGALAEPLAMETMAAVVGLPRHRLATIRELYGELALALANFEGDEDLSRRGRHAADAMREILREELESSRDERSTSSLIDHLRRSRDEAPMLDPTEELANLLIVLFGGIETTESMIGNALWCLLTRPELVERIRRSELDDRLITRLIEESLRFEPAVQTLTRHARRDVALGGAEIRKGDVVQCSIAAAHRDPSVFSDPHTFDPDRKNLHKILSFGHGAHFCLGALLARLETEIAIRGVFEELDDVQLDVPASAPPYGHEFRKPQRLVVTTTA